MGGLGSTRWRGHRKATTVEQCLLLDANNLMRDGLLRPNVHHGGVLRWLSPGGGERAALIWEVETDDDEGALRLAYYHAATREEVDATVALSALPLPFGGVRWFFRCPLVPEGEPCERRVTKLFLPPGGRHFGCRPCHALTYRSCQQAHRDESLERFLRRYCPEDVTGGYRRTAGTGGTGSE